jgi:hypothetical protein
VPGALAQRRRELLDCARLIAGGLEGADDLKLTHGRILSLFVEPGIIFRALSPVL